VGRFLDQNVTLRLGAKDVGLAVLANVVALWVVELVGVAALGVELLPVRPPAGCGGSWGRQVDAIDLSVLRRSPLTA
jgi:hypothetical protein